MAETPDPLSPGVSPKSDAPAILEAKHLTKRYTGIAALQDVSFCIHAGEVLGYLGPNGSGKSTTVKMLVGLLEPSSGQVCYQGRNIQDDLTAYKQRLGYVPEEIALYPFLSGWEYLDLTGTLRGLSRTHREQKSQELLECFALWPHRHSPIGSYSKGMRQRVALIAALLHDPEVLILDEPLSGLDVTSVLIFRKVVQFLAEQGKAVFFCAPVLEVMEKLCTHLIVLRKGTVAAYGRVDEVKGEGPLTGLEGTFLQLTEQVDADQVARRIVEAIRAPAR